MLPTTRKLSPRRFTHFGNYLYAALIVLAVTRCATRERTVHFDPKEEQIRELMDRVDAQKQELEVLKTRLGTASSGVGHSTSIEKQPIIPSVPLVKLAGPPQEDPEEEEESVVNDGQSVADSTNEVMHWYYSGLRLSAEKRYEAANREFDQFLKASPEHVYADRARYWIAQNYYRNREFSLAIIESNRLESRFPNSVRVPDSMLTRAQSYLALGQKTPAEDVLREVMQQFNGTAQSTEASRRLAELKLGFSKGDAIPLLKDGGAP